MNAICANGVDYQVVAAYVSEKLPAWCDEMICEAENAVKGLHILPGTGGELYFVGTPPNWHKNPVNDDEYVWTLNRMFHWKTLLQAHSLTGNPLFFKQVLLEWENWIDNCPRPDVDGKDLNARFAAVTPWRSLEVGIRLYTSWPWALCYLMKKELVGPNLLQKILISFKAHCEVLSVVCPVLWPNADHNHYFMENLGLLTAANLLPEQDANALYWEQAIRELRRCTVKQFTEDGGQIEGCPHYHNVCVKLLRMAIMAIRDRGIEPPSEMLDKARKAVDYSLYCQRPSGTNVPWGDSDSLTTSVEAAVDGFLMLGDRVWIDILLRQGEDAALRDTIAKLLWDVPGMIAILDDPPFFLPSNKSRLLPRTCYQHELSQAMLRTSWDRNASSLFFACRTPVNNPHAHIDPMGFDFTALGKPLLVDPGRFCYREDEDRRLFKSATWHNTITVNHCEPFEYQSSWHYGPQKRGCIAGLLDEGHILACEAVQENFAPAIHRRLVALIDDNLLVIDKIDGLAETDTVQMVYHIDSPNVQLDVPAATAHSLNDDGNILIAFSNSLSGVLEPARVSDILDVARPSKRLCLSDGYGETSRIYATLCLPFLREVPDATVRAHIQNNGQAEIVICMDGQVKSYCWVPSENDCAFSFALC